MIENVLKYISLSLFGFASLVMLFSLLLTFNDMFKLVKIEKVHPVSLFVNDNRNKKLIIFHKKYKKRIYLVMKIMVLAIAIVFIRLMFHIY